MLSRLLNRLHEPSYRRWNGFKKSYVNSNDYTNSQWAATIFWIASTILGITLDPSNYAPDIPVLPSGHFIQVTLASFALLMLLVLFPIKHGRREWPFKYNFKWYPIAWEPETHKGREWGHLRLPREGEMQIVIPFEITGEVDRYRFELHTSSDLILFKADQDRSSSDQRISADREIITCDNPDDGYINIFQVERKGSLGGSMNEWIKIIDTSDCVDGDGVNGKLGDIGEDTPGREVFHLDVRE